MGLGFTRTRRETNRVSTWASILTGCLVLLAVLTSPVTALQAATGECPDCVFKFPPSWQTTAEGTVTRVQAEGLALRLQVEQSNHPAALADSDIPAEKAALIKELQGTNPKAAIVDARIVRSSAGEPMMNIDASWTDPSGTTMHLFRLIRRCGTRIVTDIQAENSHFELLSKVSAQVHYTASGCSVFNVDAVPLFEMSDDISVDQLIPRSREGAPKSASSADAGDPSPASSSESHESSRSASDRERKTSETGTSRGCSGSVLLLSLGVGIIILVLVLRSKSKEIDHKSFEKAQSEEPYVKALATARQKSQSWLPESPPPHQSSENLSPLRAEPLSQTDGLSYRMKGSGEVPFEIVPDSLMVIGRELCQDYSSPGIRRIQNVPHPIGRLLQEQNGGRFGQGWLTLLGLDRRGIDAVRINADPLVRELYGEGWLMGFTALGAGLMLTHEDKVDVRFPDGRAFELGRHLPAALHALTHASKRETLCEMALMKRCSKVSGELAPGEIFFLPHMDPSKVESCERLPFSDALRRYFDLRQDSAQVHEAASSEQTESPPELLEESEHSSDALDEDLPTTPIVEDMPAEPAHEPEVQVPPATQDPGEHAPELEEDLIEEDLDSFLGNPGPKAE